METNTRVLPKRTRVFFMPDTLEARGRTLVRFFPHHRFHRRFTVPEQAALSARLFPGPSDEPDYPPAAVIFRRYYVRAAFSAPAHHDSSISCDATSPNTYPDFGTPRSSSASHTALIVTWLRIEETPR